MHKAKLTSKGQITLPAAVREALGLQPGEKVVFLPGEKGEFRLRRIGSIRDLAGCLRGVDAPKTNAELNDILADYAAELDAASRSGAGTESDSEAA